MYSDNHLVVQTFDGVMSVVNYNDAKVVYQRLEDENRTALDNEVVVIGKDIYYSRKNLLFGLMRTLEEGD